MMPEPQQENEVLTIKVGPAIQERRIDKYLHGRFSNFSRAMMQKQIAAGHAKVNGNIVRASFKLTAGDLIELILPELSKKEIEPEDIPLNVIYEDDDIIIVNKQANIIVHPARGNLSGTLVNALVHYSDNLSSGLGEFRPGIVHRLDRNTTGVMIVTKNDTAQWKVATQFESRNIKKEYLAILHGTPELTSDCIDAPLGIHPRHREKYAVRSDSGKPSMTVYEVQEEFRGYSLVKCKPKTGRTHQLRVHLSHIKHPIVGDDMYGGKVVYPWQLKDTEQKVEEPVIARCALHASTIEFKHPSTEQTVRFEAPLPKDMRNTLELLREYRKK